MEEQINKEIEEYKEYAFNSINAFIDDNKNKTIEDKKRVKNYLKWINKKTNIIRNEKNFSINEEQKKHLKRSKVFWIDFGFNIGKEFGGKHPAVILRVTGDSVFVIPLSSGPLPETKKNDDACVEIPFVYDFPYMKRWLNVLRMQCVSIQRIDFDNRIGRIKGKYMDKINEALRKVGVK